MTRPIIYEAFQDRLNVHDWRVEATNKEGEVYVAIFSGPQARERAEEYAQQKTKSEAYLRWWKTR